MTTEEMEYHETYVLSRIVEDQNGCWNWSKSISKYGYAHAVIKKKPWRVHRLTYYLYKGELIEKYSIDHLCRNRKCVNPNHLEQVTCKENLLRGFTNASRNKAKTHCPKGHKYNLENTYRYRGMRMCLACRKGMYKKVTKGKKLRSSRILTTE